MEIDQVDNDDLTPMKIDQIDDNLSPMEMDNSVGENLTPMEIDHSVDNNLTPMQIDRIDENLTPMQIDQIDDNLSPMEMDHSVNDNLSPMQSALVRKVLRAHRIRRPAKKQPTLNHPAKKQRLLGPDQVSEELCRVGFGLPQNFRPYLPPMPQPEQDGTDIDDNSLQMLTDGEDEATNLLEVAIATASVVATANLPEVAEGTEPVVAEATELEVTTTTAPEVPNVTEQEVATAPRRKARAPTKPTDNRRQTRSSTRSANYWTRGSSRPTLRPKSALRTPLRYVASF